MDERHLQREYKNGLVVFRDSVKVLLPQMTTSSGTATLTFDGTTTSYVVNHNFGIAPLQAFISADEINAATALKNGYFITAKTSSSFTITFLTAPAAGSATIDYDVKYGIVAPAPVIISGN